MSVLAIVCTVPLLLITQHSAKAAGTGPVLVVVAHPDDEALQMSGIMASAKSAGKQVYLAVLTNGDAGGAEGTGGSYCGLTGSAVAGNPSDSARLSLLRDKESMDAMALLPNGGLAWTNSLATSHIFFLGYPDTHLTDVANNSSSTPIQTDKTGLHHTFARSGAGANDCTGDYGTLKRGVASPYTAAALEGDMDALIAQVKPTDIYTHSTFEGHTDHREVARQVAGAVIRSHLPITMHGTLIHPEGTDGCSVTSNYQWPNPVGNASTDPDARATPTQPFTAPPPTPQVPGCAPTGGTGSWGPAGAPNERVPVPDSMKVTTLATNLKYQVINKYVSQHGCSMPNSPNCGFLRGFVKNEEIFWTQDFGTGQPLAYKDLLLSSSPAPNGYWRFGETSGGTARPAAGSISGPYDDAEIGKPGLIADDTDKSVYFGGDATGVNFADNYDFAGHAAFSLELWFKPDEAPTAEHYILAKLATGGTDGYYLTNGPGGVKFFRINAGVGASVQSSAPLQKGQAYHLVVTDDGTDMRLYVNGSQLAVGPDGVALPNTTAEFHIGAKSNGGGGITGWIDEPAVYTSSLTPATILRHYQTGAFGPTLLDTTAPAKPATPTATAGNGSATINLSPLNGEADLASYTLQRKPASAGDAAWANVRTGFTTWPITDTGLTNGTAYQYRVIALDTSANASAPSNPVTVTPAGAVIATPPVIPGPVTPGPVTPPSIKDTIKPKVKVTLAKKLARATAFKSGLKFSVSCSEACTVTTDLVIDAATAKKLHISRTVGTRKVKFTKSGKKTITVKLTKKAVKALKRMHKTTVSIRTKATDTAGNTSRVTSKTVLR